MDFKNRLKQCIYPSRSLWIAGQPDSTLFGVVDDTTTTKFTGRACAVHCNSLPVVVDKVVVKVLKFSNNIFLTNCFLPEALNGQTPCEIRVIFSGSYILK